MKMCGQTLSINLYFDQLVVQSSTSLYHAPCDKFTRDQLLCYIFACGLQ